jgi:hypothetical protein
MVDSSRQHFALVIASLPNGGYVVSDLQQPGGGFVSTFLFSSTTIDEALKFIRDNLSRPS